MIKTKPFFSISEVLPIAQHGLVETPETTRAKNSTVAKRRPDGYRDDLADANHVKLLPGSVQHDSFLRSAAFFH